MLFLSAIIFYYLSIIIMIFIPYISLYLQYTDIYGCKNNKKKWNWQAFKRLFSVFLFFFWKMTGGNFDRFPKNILKNIDYPIFSFHLQLSDYQHIKFGDLHLMNPTNFSSYFAESDYWLRLQFHFPNDVWGVIWGGILYIYLYKYIYNIPFFKSSLHTC